MGEPVDETKIWLESSLISNLKDVLQRPHSALKYEVSLPSVPLFVSKVIFLSLKFIDADREDTINLVVKTPAASKAIRELLKVDEMFHNEILFYRKISKKGSDYPRCIYTRDGTVDDFIIVIENISDDGFQMCPQVVDIEMKYVLAALREIGRFHAKGYALRDKCPEEFFETVNEIRYPRYRRYKTNAFVPLMNYIARGIVKDLREEKYDKCFCDKVEPIFNNAFESIMLAAFETKGPLRTLCHGDFTVNNVFFKKFNTELKAKLIDFALIMYASPTVDLSTFICLNVSREDRKNKFFDMFDVYHTAVKDYLAEVDISNIEEFSKQRFLEDYKRHALFGFMISCFFLPAIHGIELPDFDLFLRLSEEERIKRISAIGGVEMKRILKEMLLDMRELGCLDHVLK